MVLFNLQAGWVGGVATAAGWGSVGTGAQRVGQGDRRHRTGTQHVQGEGARGGGENVGLSTGLVCLRLWEFRLLGYFKLQAGMVLSITTAAGWGSGSKRAQDTGQNNRRQGTGTGQVQIRQACGSASL